MHVDVAFAPELAKPAPTAVVIDVLRATSTIAQALDAGYERVQCCVGVDDARALRDELGHGVLAGERQCVRIPGFDLGNSPREFLEPADQVAILTTTNGTRALVAAAERCDLVFAASLSNLGAVATAVLGVGRDVSIVCAGVEGAFATDDAYCAGLLVTLLEGERTDAADAAVRLYESFETAEDGLRASQSGRNLLAAELEEDIAWCARVDSLAVVPRVARTTALAVEITAQG
ncbi:MAG: 2-phosphosulfolactate phosphatase [Gaiellaceae bacterium]